MAIDPNCQKEYDEYLAASNEWVTACDQMSTFFSTSTVEEKQFVGCVPNAPKSKSLYWNIVPITSPSQPKRCKLDQFIRFYAPCFTGL